MALQPQYPGSGGGLYPATAGSNLPAPAGYNAIGQVPGTVPVGQAPSGGLVDPNQSPVSGGGMAPYLGFVATHMVWPNNHQSGNKQLFSRSRHVARDDMSDIKLGYTNMMLAGVGGTEYLPGYTTTIKCSIEYPVGAAPQLLTFSGGSSGVIAADGQIVFTDLTNLTTKIPRGAAFYIRTYQTSPGGVVYAAGRGASQSGAVASNGETITVGVTVTDYTESTTVPNATSNWVMYGPCAILGTTIRPSFFVFGDSRAYGSGETPFYGGLNQFGACGIVERAVSRYAAICNPSIPSAKAVDAAATNSSYNVRGVLPQYASHFINELGINDCSGGYTYAQLIANLRAMVAKFGNKPTLPMTLDPSTSASTDGWLTVGGQTTQATGETVRVAYNNTLSGGGLDWPFCGVIDTRPIYESAPNSGKFKAAMRTYSDGQMNAGSNILTSASANFTPDDRGCGVTVLGAGAAGAPLVGYISAVTSSTTVTIGNASFAAVNAATTVSGATWGFPLTVDGVHTTTQANRVQENDACWQVVAGLLL